MPGWKAVRRGMVRTRGCAAISSPRGERPGARGARRRRPPFGAGPGGPGDPCDVDAGAAAALEQALGGELVEGGDDGVARDRELAREGADRGQPALAGNRAAEDQLAQLVAQLAVKRAALAGAQGDEIERIAALVRQTVLISNCTHPNLMKWPCQWEQA